MKRTLSMIALAALTVGLLGSCSKINERLDNLDKRIDGLENEQIASINTQIANINSSIADLGQIRSDISSLKQSAETHGQEIFALQEADETLRNRILNLEDYIDGILPKYAEKEWIEATFSTLKQYEATCDTIAKIDARIGALDAKLSKDIKACADSLTKWVNKTFEGYYTAAQMDAKVAQMKSDIDSAKAANKITDVKADSISAELTKTKTEVDTAKAAIRAEYKAAVKAAIEESEGKLTKELTEAITTVNGKIESLTTKVGNLETSVNNLLGRVIALEGMIQSVTIVPAYRDGSLENVEGGILTIDCIISPASAANSLTKDYFKVLVNTVKTKAVTLDTAKVSDIKIGENGIVSIFAQAPAKPSTGSTHTAALRIKDGANADYTTEFHTFDYSGKNVKVVDLKENDTEYNKVYIVPSDPSDTKTVGGPIPAKIEDGKKTFDEEKTTVIEVRGIGTVTFDKDATKKINENADNADSVYFTVKDVTSDAQKQDKEIVYQVTMTTVDANTGKEVFSETNAAGEVTMEIPLASNVADVTKVTLLDGSDEPIDGGVVYGSVIYDSVNKIVTFKVNHFSKYAVGYILDDGNYHKVTGISLDKSALELVIGTSKIINPTVSPDNASNKNVIWSSSDTTKVKVDTEGKVTAVALGTATVTATSMNDRSKIATCTVTVVKEVKTMAQILATASGIPESQNLTPPANAWVNSTDPDCKAFVGIDAEGDKLFVIKKEGLSNPPAVCMDDEFEKIDDNTYKRTEPDFTFTIKMTEGKFTSLEFNTNVERIIFLNGTYSAPVSSPTFKAVYNTNGDANTLTFYFDANDHSGEGITVYEDGTANYLFDNSKSNGAKWGYNDKRDSIKSVAIDASVADYKGLTSTTFMFQGMATATNISGAEYLDMSNVTDMSFMFNNFGGGANGNPTTLNSVPNVSGWNTGNVTTMAGMFESYGNFSSKLDKVPDVSAWNTGKVANMAYMFQKYGHESQNFNAVPDVSNWNTGNVTNMQQMFNEYGYKSTALNTVPNVSGWNTASVKSMNGMFKSYGNSSTALAAVPVVGNWNTANVTTMADMFYEYGHESTVLNTVPDVSKWNTGNVTTVLNMFQNYGYSSTALSTVPNVSNWKTGKVTKIKNLFNGYGHTSDNIDCTLNLSGWDLSEITGTSDADDVFNFNPKTFNVTIPAKTGEKSNEGGKWYYGNGTNYIAPPEGKTFTLLALKGVFSVSATKKVRFSKGNLQATYNSSASTYTWGFAANQYGYIGNAAGNTTIDSQTNGAVVDLFGWSTASTTYGISTSTSDKNYSGDFVDWGKAIDDKGTWSTLSKDEWKYLFDTRKVNGGTKEGKSYQIATINSDATSVDGMILYPDDFTSQTGATSYTSAEWTKMEENGCVFLPAAGSRDGSEVGGVGGGFWSSTVSSDQEMAYLAVFYDGRPPFVSDDFRHLGYSVRLVTEVK